MLNKLSTFLFLALLMGIVYIIFFYDIKLGLNETISDEPDFVFENIVISHFYDEKLESEFKSSKAKIYRKDNKIYLLETQGAFFLDNTTSIRFNSSNLTYDLDKSSIDMKSPYLVYLSNVAPVWLTSQDLSYSVNQKLISSDSLTKIYFNEGLVESHKMSFDLNNQKVYLDEDPSFNLRLPNVK